MSPARRPGRNGGELLAGGKPGNKGGGRATVDFKRFLAERRTDPTVQRAFGAAMRNAKSRNFAAAWKIASAYDEDRPAKVIAVELRGFRQVEVAFRLIRERIRARVAPDVADPLLAEINQCLIDLQST